MSTQTISSVTKTGQLGTVVLPSLEAGSRRFWSGYVRLGLAVFFVESLAVLAYAILTPSGAHRVALVGMSVATVAGCGAVMCWADRMSMSDRRAELATAVIVVASVLLTIASMLDGGIDSPLVYFIVLPLTAAALALPPRLVLFCGAVVTLEMVLTASSDADILLSTSRLLLLFALLGGVLVLTVGAAVGRSALEREEATLVDELGVMAMTDSLTGCSNQGAFNARLRVEVERAIRSGAELSLIIVDVDLFKSFNDARGHARGDQELATLGSRLRGAARTGDVVARIGGDEFAIILPETDLAGALDFAVRLTSRLRADERLEVTISLGVASLDRTERTTTRLFRDADAALYDAKALGRDQVHSRGRQDEDVAPVGLRTSRNDREDRELVEDRLRAIRREMTESVSVLQALQVASPAGLGFVDRDLRFRVANPALAALRGATPEDLLGRTVRDVFPECADELEPLLRQVIDQDAPVVTDLLGGVSNTETGETREWSMYLFPVRVTGLIAGAGAVLVDVTDAQRAADAQRSSIEQIVAALGATAEVRDPYTAGHQDRVAQIAAAIATELGCTEDVVSEIWLAARIHDIGKVGIPSEILTKPGRLSDAELGLVRTHAQIGYNLLHGVHFPERVAEIVHHHHERLDGSGYPDGLRGHDVSFGARVVAVADVAEAIAARRPYRAALGVDASIAALTEGRGSLFDPEVVDVLVAMLNDGRISLPGPSVEARSAS